MRLKELFQRALLVVLSPWAGLMIFGMVFQSGLSLEISQLIATLVVLYMIYKAIVPWHRSRATVGDTFNMWKKWFK